MLLGVAQGLQQSGIVECLTGFFPPFWAPAVPVCVCVCVPLPRGAPQTDTRLCIGLGCLTGCVYGVQPGSAAEECLPCYKLVWSEKALSVCTQQTSRPCRRYLSTAAAAVVAAREAAACTCIRNCSVLLLTAASSRAFCSRYSTESGAKLCWRPANFTNSARALEPASCHWRHTPQTGRKKHTQTPSV